MGIKNKFNDFVEKLSQKSFRMNAIIFAILWTVYITASFYLTLWFGMGGWSALFTLPLSILFYSIIGLAILVGLVISCIKTKTASVNFYPKIFTYLFLVPQIIYALVNPFQDCGDSYCAFAPNVLAALFENNTIIFLIVVLISGLLAVLAIIAYITGTAILSRKMFGAGNFPAENAENPILKRTGSYIAFSLIFAPIIAIIVFSVLAQGSFTAELFAYALCPKDAAQWDKSICAWPMHQCWAIFDKSDRDNCYLQNAIDKAVKKKDITVCDKEINDVNGKDVCYDMIARTIQD